METKRYVLAAVATGGMLLTSAAGAQNAPTPPPPQGSGATTPSGQMCCIIGNAQTVRPRVVRRRTGPPRPSALDRLRREHESLTGDLTRERMEREEADRALSDRLQLERAAREQNDQNLAQQLQMERTARDELDRRMAARLMVAESRLIPARGGGPQAVTVVTRPRWRPRFEIGLDGGGMGFTGAASQVLQRGGASWGARLGLAFTNWIAIEGRYVGGWVPLQDQASTASYMINGGAATLRLSVPTPYVRPYAYAGAGGYQTTVLGDPAAVQSTPLRTNGFFGVPTGGGIEVLMGRYFSIAGEGGYTFLFGNTLTSIPEITSVPGFWNASGVLRVRL